MDGFGIAPKGPGNAVADTPKPNLDRIFAQCPGCRLAASGLDVGLPEGQMGNSEVGHTNMGAGRVVFQDLPRISRDIDTGAFFQNPAFLDAMSNCREWGSALHLMGLLSDGGVHSHINHLFALLKMAGEQGIEKVYVHCFLDGRDVPPSSGKHYVELLQAKMQQLGVGKIASVMGRYYAMDRDKRWDRVQQAYDAIVCGQAPYEADAAEAVQKSYDAGVTDEFVKPVCLTDASGSPVGRIKAGDAVVFINFRNDRAKELTAALTQPAAEGEDRAGMQNVPLYFATMTPYDAKYQGLHVLFPKENVVNTIGEWVAAKGLKQLRIAETEKYAHVTFFLNGGREDTFEGEDRILVPSPKVATYDLKPEMSAYEVADKLAAALSERKYNFVCLNFANGDMVGHTGVYEAIEKAVLAVDACARTVIEAARKAGYDVVQIADHGNADHAVNADGSPNTAHSLNPVPVVVVSDRVAGVRNGVLADVAPTVLALMGVEPPAEMTGKSLVEWK